MLLPSRSKKVKGESLFLNACIIIREKGECEVYVGRKTRKEGRGGLCSSLCIGREVERRREEACACTLVKEGMRRRFALDFA